MKIWDKISDKMWKKGLIIFAVFFIVVLALGFVSVNYLHDTVVDNHIHTEAFTVIDKINEGNEYIIEGDNNKTYNIINDDGYGKKMYNNIELNKKYNFVIQEDVTNGYNYIMQVHNDTSED